MVRLPVGRDVRRPWSVPAARAQSSTLPDPRAVVSMHHHLGLKFGRLSIYFEPRDVWVGLYVHPYALYVCPLPCIVIKWERW